MSAPMFALYVINHSTKVGILQGTCYLIQRTRYFRCLVCDKAFKWKSHLKRHFQIHGGDDHNSNHSSQKRTQESQVLEESHVSESTGSEGSCGKHISTTADNRKVNEGLCFWNDAQLHCQEQPFIIDVKVEES